MGEHWLALCRRFFCTYLYPRSSVQRSSSPQSYVWRGVMHSNLLILLRFIAVSVPSRLLLPRLEPPSTVLPEEELQCHCQCTYGLSTLHYQISATPSPLLCAHTTVLHRVPWMCLPGVGTLLKFWLWLVHIKTSSRSRHGSLPGVPFSRLGDDSAVPTTTTIQISLMELTKHRVRWRDPFDRCSFHCRRCTPLQLRNEQQPIAYYSQWWESRPCIFRH